MGIGLDYLPMWAMLVDYIPVWAGIMYGLMSSHVVVLEACNALDYGGIPGFGPKWLPLHHKPPMSH